MRLTYKSKAIVYLVSMLIALIPVAWFVWVGALSAWWLGMLVGGLYIPIRMYMIGSKIEKMRNVLHVNVDALLRAEAAERLRINRE